MISYGQLCLIERNETCAPITFHSKVWCKRITKSFCSLLENGPWNRLETVLGTGFQPVPPNRDQWRHPKTSGFSPGALGIHWYRLERPTDTNEFFSLFCPNPVLFVLFINVYSFIISKRTRALQYYMFIGRTCSISQNI